MPRVRIVVVEGELSVEEIARLANTLGKAADVVLPPTVTGQSAVLRTPELPVQEHPTGAVQTTPAPAETTVERPTFRTLRNAIEYFQAQGHKELGALLTQLKQVRGDYPFLARLDDATLEDRVRRTLEMA